ncbi:hypothetical protein evm_015235 [Chilo suppressalis]|nr:hypothetical protein evm_015235 [Chilo suppressalis]
MFEHHIRYLTAIKEYRRQGKKIYYQDETWINEGHTTGKVWVDTTIESSKQAFSKGLTGLKSRTGKGQRLIISHIGSDEGFVEAGLLIFESKKNSMDYHEELNSECFEEWLKSILPNLKPNAVLVLDNAPYHSRKVEQVLKEMTPENWRQCINHAIKVEDKMWQLDHIIDECVDSFIINVTDSDSNSEYTDSESESESISTVMNKNV